MSYHHLITPKQTDSFALFLVYTIPFQVNPQPLLDPLLFPPCKYTVALKRNCKTVTIMTWGRQKEFRTGFPQKSYFGMWIILSWRQWRPCGLRRNPCPSLNYLQESELGALLIMRVITRNKLCDLPIGQGKLLVPLNNCFYLLRMTSLHSKAPGFILSSGWHIYLIFPIS